MLPIVPLVLVVAFCAAVFGKRKPKAPTAPASPTAGMVDNPQGPVDWVTRNGEFMSIPAGAAVPAGWELYVK